MAGDSQPISSRSKGSMAGKISAISCSVGCHQASMILPGRHDQPGPCQQWYVAPEDVKKIRCWWMFSFNHCFIEATSLKPLFCDDPSALSLNHRFLGTRGKQDLVAEGRCCFHSMRNRKTNNLLDCVHQRKSCAHTQQNASSKPTYPVARAV